MLDEAIKLAAEVTKHAYAPYSEFPVGCVIIDQTNEMHVGCNVENASYGLTMCAERNATGNAISSGAKQFKTIIIASREAVTPCGACRQVLAEFSSPETEVILLDLDGNQRERHSLTSLLPHQFKL
ncbi:MAG: cytidine deaminase [Rubripirellula sp.]|nr:cytidine deaminase [Rubripirellula sp.]